MSLRSLIASLMELDEAEVGEDTGRETVAQWDSLRELMLASALESEYGITLTLDEFQMLHSVRTVMQVLERRGIAERLV